MANLFEPEWDGESARPGFAYRRAKLGGQAGGERLGASLYELPPGQATFPFHAHFANEELLIVTAGDIYETFRLGQGADYWEGEEPPPEAP